jgi:vacuolar-type H+-ATPase catalytic subunit A/Vma1
VIARYKATVSRTVMAYDFDLGTVVIEAASLEEAWQKARAKAVESYGEPTEETYYPWYLSGLTEID